MKYKLVISLGHFCGVAQEMERIGLRTASYPFDWLITENFEKELCLVENNFDGFLDIDDLQQEMVKTHYYSPRNELQFYHDFKDEGVSVEQQLVSVRKKYARRIERFYESAKQPTLFIRYLSGKDMDKNVYEQMGGAFCSN